jgi:hypothetical protein
MTVIIVFAGAVVGPVCGLIASARRVVACAAEAS